jgi:hypothetical protein
MRGENSFLFSPITDNLWNDPPPYIFDLHTKLLMPCGAILGKARVFLYVVILSTHSVHGEQT